MRFGIVAAIGLALLLVACTSNQNAGGGATPGQQATMAENAASGAWTMYGHDYLNQRYSSLNQITTDNVSKLKPAWIFHSKVPGAYETTPIVIGNTMYITTANDHAFALDAKSGKIKWRYDPTLGTSIFCCGNVNRGVAFADGKVFLGQLDGKLVALNAANGKVAWSIQAGDNTAGYGLTMAPLVYNNMVIVGGAGGEFGVRGSVSAFSTRDGKQLWKFYTIGPGWEGPYSPKTPNGADLHRDIAAEKKADVRYKNAWMHGGAAVWMTPALDTSTGTLFVTAGNPSPDLDGSPRPGDNRWSDSVIALDVNTGKMKWAYQEIPHDIWDLDTTSPAVLFDTTVNGTPVSAVGQAGKTAWFYVLDRNTGKQIRVSDPFDPQLHMFALPTAKGTYMLPGANGGDEWSPVSYDPNLHYVYIATLNQPMDYFVHPAPLQHGQLWLGSAFQLAPGAKQDGSVVAVNVDTGKIAWTHKVDYPMIGGPASTAGGLTFVGESNGSFDAFDSKSGKVLWQYKTNAGVNAAPMTYQLGDTQYVAVASGGSFQIHTKYGDALYVFSLGK